MIFLGYYCTFLELLLLLSQYAVTFSRASEKLRNASLTDFSKCKLTQFGTDYMGSTATTAGGIRCQMWYSEKPVHKVNEAITDTDFPERSIRLARNYCRNPTKDPRGPWCYTMDTNLIDDECEVPLCNFGECRISGTGSEYGGTYDTTSSGRKCKSWDKRLKLAVNKTQKFGNNQFSDLSRNKAKNFCRNPDSSSGGPWCWVDAENYDIVEKEYCSIPFCDDKDCLVYSKNASTYSILTSLNSAVGNITFWIKLWNPGDQQIGQARLLFTNLQVPTSAKVIAEDWRAGVEIVISNYGSGQEYPRSDDETDFEETPSILVGSKWTALWVAWGGGFISVGYEGSKKPIFLDEFKKKNTISSMYPESFSQYGIMGTGVLWSMQFCEDTCEVHTTYGIEFLRVWPLRQSNSSHDLEFHVRASHKATIQLTQTPAVLFPCLLIVLGQHDSTLVMYQEKETSMKEILLELRSKNILNFWAWHEFTISIFGMALQMFWNRDYGREELFSVEHHIVQTVRWFSIGSEDTIAHWTLFCAPTEADAVEAPWFPNCVSSSSDSRYEGSQWTTENQVPCIPWISDKIPENDKKDDSFIDGSALKALNKCRNPTNDPEGPFCYTATQSESVSVKKQYCPIRKCRSSECRMAGTANDYLGTLSVTRSGRKCAPWVSGYEQLTVPTKNISLSALIARAFISLKAKREDALENSIVDVSSEKWDEIGLRSRLPRESEPGYTRKTPRQRRVTEIQKQNGIYKLIGYSRTSISPDSETSTTVKSVDDNDSPNSKSETLLRRQISEISSALLEDDDDDDDDDFFKLKPATFGPTKSSTSVSRHQEIGKTNSDSPKDDNHSHFYHPGIFQPYEKPKTTPKSPEHDDDDDIHSHFYHPGIFQPYEKPKTTPKSPEHDDDDDDDDDFFKLKPATFGPTKSSTSVSRPGTTRHQEIGRTNSDSPKDDDHSHFYHPGIFQSHEKSKTTPKSPENDDDDDDDDDFFKLKPATFGQTKSSKFTSVSSPGTTRKQAIGKTTSDSPEDDDNSNYYHPGTFQPYEKSKSPEDEDDDDDDDDDFFKLKPATLGRKKSSSKSVSISSLGTTRKQEIRKTTTGSSEDHGDSHNYHPGTFQPYGKSKATSKSPEDDDEDDDDDFFKLKPATLERRKSSKSIPISSPGTTRKQEIGETTSNPLEDDIHSRHYHLGTFQPKITSKSPESDNDDYDDDDDDDDDDLLNLKPVTFRQKKSSESIPISSPGTTRQEEIEETTYTSPRLNTIQEQKISESTSKPPENDHKLETTPLHTKMTATTPALPENDKYPHNHHVGTSQPHEIPKTTSKSTESPDHSSVYPSSSTSPSSTGSTSRNLPTQQLSNATPQPESTEGSTTISAKKDNSSVPIHTVDPRYLNDTLYPEQNARNATNYCRNPSRNIAGTWCYTTDPQVPQDLCNVRDCELPEECTFLVRGHGTGRRLYVLPEYRSEGLHFSLKEWEPDRPDSITFVILSEDEIQSRFILKIGAMNNEKVLLYYETKKQGIKLVKQKTLPHLLYLGKWTGFVIRMDRGEIKLYYEGAPYPLFEWKDPEPAEAFLPVYYYYSSELGNSIGVAFNCDTKCHIEQTTTARFSRILPISIWEKEETPSPHRLVLMLRGEGTVLLPLLMLPATPGYYALTIGEMGQWVFFIKNRHPMVHILHKQDANGPLFTPNTWTNITIQFHNYTIQVLRNGTEVFHYTHNLPLLFYLFSLSVDKGGWVTWAANCIPTDIDGAPLDGGWSEWGPWSCSASCNGGMGLRKRTCDNPEPNIRGQPCLGPSTSSGHCNMNKCGDVTDVTVALIKRRIRIEHKSIIVKEGDGVTISADTDIVSALRNETPTAQINWSRNGIFLEEEEDRVKLEDTAVSISFTVANDSGVYTQTLHRVDDSHLIFKIITLGVVPTTSEIVIRESLSFSVICHCVVLGYVYSDLRISWILNGKVYKDYGVSTPIAVNVDHIPKANITHHGEWRCEVVQSDLNFKWTTNVIKVRVLGPPNWRTHLMEDKLTRPIFGWMPSEGFVAFSAFFLTLLIIASIVASTIWYLRFQESLKYKSLRKKEPIDTKESFTDSETEKLITEKEKSN